MGRPKLNKKFRKRAVTMTILPSVWTRFQKLCTESGFSASSRVEKMMRAFLLKNDD